MISFSKHVLETVVETERVSVYRLREPGTRVGMVQVSASPEGVCIQGDYMVGGAHAVATMPGYGIEWFASRQDEDCLAAKFALPRAWHPELAEETIRSWVLGDDTPEGTTETNREEWLEALDLGEPSLYEVLTYSGVDVSEGIPGWGYDPADVALLGQIQRAFAAAWAENKKPSP